MISFDETKEGNSNSKIRITRIILNVALQELLER